VISAPDEVHEISVGSVAATDRLYITGRSIFIGLPNLSDFSMNTTYLIEPAGGGVVADMAGNLVGNFSVEAATILEDVEAPILMRMTPPSQAEVEGAVTSPMTTIVLYFSEPVQVGSGFVNITDGENVSAYIAVDNSEPYQGMVYVEQHQVHIKTYMDLAFSAMVNLSIDDGAFLDWAGNPYLGETLVDTSFRTRSPYSMSLGQADFSARLRPVFHSRDDGFILYGGELADGSCLTDWWTSTDGMSWESVIQADAPQPIGKLTQSAVASNGDLLLVADVCGSSSQVQVYRALAGTTTWTAVSSPLAVPSGIYISPAFPTAMSGHSVAVLKGWQLVVVNAANNDTDTAGVWQFLDEALLYVARVARPALPFGVRSDPGLHSNSGGQLLLLGGYRCSFEAADWSCMSPLNDLWRSDDGGLSWQALAGIFDASLPSHLEGYAHALLLDDRLVVVGGNLSGQTSDSNLSRSAYMTVNPAHESVIESHFLGVPREDPVGPDTLDEVLVYWREAIRFREGGPPVRLVDLGERQVAGGTGDEADTEVETVASIDNQLLTLKLDDELDGDRRFGVIIPTGSIEDLEGNVYDGDNATPIFEFSTSSSGPSRRRRSTGDTTAPTLVDLLPRSEGSPDYELPSSSTILAIFSENVVAGGGGGITFTPTHGSEVISINSSDAIIAEEYAIFIPPLGLIPGEVYNVTLDIGSFTDEAGNDFAGYTTEHVISTRPKVKFELVSDEFLAKRHVGSSGAVDSMNTLWLVGGQQGGNSSKNEVTSYATLAPIHCAFAAPHPGFDTCDGTVCDDMLGIGTIPRVSRVFRAPDERAVYLCRNRTSDPRRTQVGDVVAEFEDNRTICACPLCLEPPTTWADVFEARMGPFPPTVLGERTPNLKCGPGEIPSNRTIECIADTWYMGAVGVNPTCVGEPCDEPPNLTLVENALALNAALSTDGLDCETIEPPSIVLDSGGLCKVDCAPGYTSLGGGFVCTEGEFAMATCYVQNCTEETLPLPSGGAWDCGANRSVPLGESCLWQCNPGHLVVFPPPDTTSSVSSSSSPTTAPTSTSTTETTMPTGPPDPNFTSTSSSTSSTTVVTSTSTTPTTAVTTSTSTSTSVSSTTTSTTTATGLDETFFVNNGQPRECIVLGISAEAPVSLEEPEVICEPNDCGAFSITPGTDSSWTISYGQDTLLTAKAHVTCGTNNMGNVSDASGSRTTQLAFDLTCAALTTDQNNPDVGWVDASGQQVTWQPCVTTLCSVPQVNNGSYDAVAGSGTTDAGTGQEWGLTCDIGFFPGGTNVATCQQNGLVANVVECSGGGCLGTDAVPTGTANGTTCAENVEEGESCRATCSSGRVVGEFLCLFGAFAGTSECVSEQTSVVNASTLVGLFQITVSAAGLAPLPGATTTAFQEDILQALVVALGVPAEAFARFTTRAVGRRLWDDSWSMRGAASRLLTSSSSVTAEISYEIDVPDDMDAQTVATLIEDLEDSSSSARRAFSSELASIDYVLEDFQLLSTPTVVVDNKVAPTPAPAAVSEDSGVAGWVVALLVILGILALCCCCCFGFKVFGN